MKNDLSLFVDIDDVLVHSSPLIQKQVNAKTIYKTKVLENIEQLIRNIVYFKKELSAELESATRENRIPNMERFPKEFFINTNKINNTKDLYNYYIESCDYYLNIANEILNQFLEQRDMFLENDNLAYGNYKEYNYPAEEKNILEFKKRVFNSWNNISLINNFCLREAQKISNDAKANNLYPNYGELVKTDSNDIIRTNKSGVDYEYFIYEKPIDDIKNLINCNLLEYIYDNFNIKKRESEELIDYNNIYQMDNVNKKAVLMIHKALLSYNINNLYLISHHNGEREFAAKKALMAKLFPNGIFIGLRFHAIEHNILRRSRSSKFNTAINYCDSSPSNMLLIDDSKANCSDWKANGGEVILYREVSDAEKTSNIEQSEYYRIIDFDNLGQIMNEIINNKNKRKVLK